MNEILKIKIIKINEFWYSWYIDYIDKKVFKKNISENFQIDNKDFCYFAKENPEDINVINWKSECGYGRYVIYLPINNPNKQPALIRKELVKDFKKAIKWINNNVK